MIIENFDAVADNPEFLDMSAENVLEIIKYDDIQVQNHCRDKNDLVYGQKGNLHQNVFQGIIQTLLIIIIIRTRQLTTK